MFDMMKPLLVDKISVLLRVPSVEEAVNFYKKAFGAVECPVPSSPENELLGIHATKLNILPKFPILITDNPLVPEISPGALNLYVRGGQLADLEAVVTKAVCAGATADGELAKYEIGGSLRYCVVSLCTIYRRDICDHRRNTHDLLERPRKKKRRRPVEQEDDPNASYLSKLKILLKIPDPLKEEAAVKFYSTAFGAGAPQFPTKNEIPDITSTHLELARNYYIMISRTEQTHHVEELVERLEQVGAVLEGNIVYDNPIDKFRRMAKVKATHLRSGRH
ncbi:hypothetical protein Tsubulata_021608 [Turnera subulata]|uniref:VOC domain-containing protein n=1 Tax=Turnera subulata TaxID=218843 RepID=A0A9Q0FY26_9ROSI|nr:hypothetical protein Tsubulata_021608 [Turnera subulata]